MRHTIVAQSTASGRHARVEAQIATDSRKVEGHKVEEEDQRVLPVAEATRAVVQELSPHEEQAAAHAQPQGALDVSGSALVTASPRQATVASLGPFFTVASFWPSFTRRRCNQLQRPRRARVRLRRGEHERDREEVLDLVAMRR